MEVLAAQENKNPYGIVYKVTNKINNKIYIGISTQIKRGGIERGFYNRYGGCISNTTNEHLQNSIIKYGVENFDIIPVFDVAYSKEELDNLEDYYISMYDTLNPAKGYNKQSGGTNGKPGQETRGKMSEARLGKPISPGARKKMSERWEEEWRKELIRDVMREEIICLNTGEIFSSIKECGESLCHEPLNEVETFNFRCAISKHLADPYAANSTLKGLAFAYYIDGKACNKEGNELTVQEQEEIIARSSGLDKIYNNHIDNEVNYNSIECGCEMLQDKKVIKAIILNFLYEDYQDTDIHSDKYIIIKCIRDVINDMIKKNMFTKRQLDFISCCKESPCIEVEVAKILGVSRQMINILIKAMCDKVALFNKN